MKTHIDHGHRKQRPHWLLIIWIVVMTLSAFYIGAVASQYLWLKPEQYAFSGQQQNYTDHATIMMLHIGAGVVALLSGALQFIPALKRFRRFHRGVGATYAVSVAIGGVAGLVASTFAYGGASNTAAFGLMSAAWLTTTAMAVLSIVKGNVLAHQRWMKRSFAVTLAAVTLRVELGILIVVGGMKFSDVYLIVPWTSWVLNLLVVEWVPATTRFSMPARRNKQL